ncbi:MAG TPA: class I SAM-dependent methyltransferase [Bryobacteraceae bacterium]|nr:class I SAM-dependent methyltransferase [Bryobacteraceae bacterium]
MSPEMASPLNAATATQLLKNDQLMTDVELRQDYCDFCGIPGTFYSRASDHSILRCKRCNLIWTDPLLSRRPSFTGEETYKANELSQKARFREQLRSFLRNTGVEDPRQLRLLEIGPGLGFFLDVCEESGIAAEGCDLADHAIRYANQKRERVRKGTLDSHYAGAGFDAIFAFNLIEHLPHPKQFLEDAAKALRTGGTLVLETPVQEGLFHRLARLGDKFTGGRINLYGMRPSGHVYKFSKKTFRRLAADGQWRVVSQKNISSPWGEIWGNSDAVEMDHKGLYRFALPAAFSVANATGQGNRVFVMLRKES